MVLTFYGLPLNIIRDVYLTARSFIIRLRALIRYRNATRDMDRRYPNATEEELTALSDRTCIICREEMIASGDNQNTPAAQAENNANNANQTQDGPNVTPKKLPCGHIFHFQCLRSWLERQQSCPTWLVTPWLALSGPYGRRRISTNENFPAAAQCSKLIRRTVALPRLAPEALVRQSHSRTPHPRHSQGNQGKQRRMVPWAGSVV